MTRIKGQLIKDIVADSIAQDLLLERGDRLISIDGQPVLDYFDYQMRQLQSKLIILVSKKDGSQIEFDLEKDEDEDLGLIFEQALLTDCTECHNKCIFCFIDQLPPGLRKTLYFKDDDLRMSFLHGNYVTLTNIEDDELARIISYRFSPMNISVHATDPQTRTKMMRHRNAGKLLTQLQKITAAGIDINCQIVLCPEINDGPVLEQTLTDLTALGDRVISIAIVPVGVTRYRQEKKLLPLRSFSSAEAATVIKTVNQWQQKMLAERGRRIVFAGDEFYLNSEMPLPAAAAYEQFAQLENGVGMSALFIEGIESFLGHIDRPARTDKSFLPKQSTKRIVIITGAAARPVLEPFIDRLAEHFGLNLSLKIISNDFFGSSITVAGLLTGQDLKKQLKAFINRSAYENICLIPDVMLKADEDVFLDDISIQDLMDYFACEFVVTPSNAEGLISMLAKYSNYYSNYND